MNEIDLPGLLLLEDYGGDYSAFIDAVFKIFKTDFIKAKNTFRKLPVKLKFYPIFQERPYCFYHITHKGEEEGSRTPDLRRCERIAWTKPVIINCDTWFLRVWPQKRGNANRICIWLQLAGEPDYFVILDVRKDFYLLWTVFVAEYAHEKRKKEQEYTAWLKTQVA